MCFGDELEVATSMCDEEERRDPEQCALAMRSGNENWR